MNLKSFLQSFVSKLLLSDRTTPPNFYDRVITIYDSANLSSYSTPIWLALSFVEWTNTPV